MHKIKIFFYIFLLIFTPYHVFSYENVIVYKVNNEIITSHDIKKEANYLISLNENLKSLKKKEIVQLAHQSIVNEKIKIIELKKYFSFENPNNEVVMQILKNIYKDIGIKNEKEFESYVSQYDISAKWIKKKLQIESLWNNLIYRKYNNKVFINKDEIKKQVNKEFKTKKKQKKIFLSEILVKITKKNEQEALIGEIKKSIEEIGFDNTANIYSISNTAKKGGRIGWLNESSLSPIIVKEVKKLKKGNITQPIKLTSGYLILKINDIKITDIKIDVEKIIKSRIANEQNRQLDQFSTMYFNKVKTNIKIDAKR